MNNKLNEWAANNAITKKELHDLLFVLSDSVIIPQSLLEKMVDALETDMNVNETLTAYRAWQETK